MDLVKYTNNIVVQRIGQIAYIYFNFNQGAMNSHQCFVLQQAIAQSKTTDAKVIVLMGGEHCWCDGIHINNINISCQPAIEREQNVCAIDDVVQELMDSPKQITVAAIRNDFGAGAIALALACDKVMMRQSVVFNPNSQPIDLYGKSSWRFLLTKKLGEHAAAELIQQHHPFLAAELVQLGLADKLYDDEWATYHAALFEFCEQFIDSVSFEGFLARKVAVYVAPYQSNMDDKWQDSAALSQRFYHHNNEHEGCDFVYGMNSSSQQGMGESSRL